MRVATLPTAMPHISPFHELGHEGEAIDAISICADSDWANIDMFEEWYQAALKLNEEGLGHPTLFALRHLVELGLKLAVYGDHNWQPGHDLLELLDKLPKVDPLSDPKTDEDEDLRGFILDLQALDQKAEAGRYGFNSKGTQVTLPRKCHIEKQDVLKYANLIASYVRTKNEWVAAGS